MLALFLKPDQVIVSPKNKQKWVRKMELMTVRIQSGRRRKIERPVEVYAAQHEKALMDKVPEERKEVVEKALRCYWLSVALEGHKPADTLTYPFHVSGQRVFVSVQGERGIGYWAQEAPRRPQRYM